MSDQAVQLDKVFFESDFSIHKYLANCTQKNDLETLRQQLKNYGTMLHNSMTEILKTETESIIDLAEHLTNLDGKINNLILPTAQLREEILILYNTLKTTRHTFDIYLDKIKANYDKRYALNLQLSLISTKKRLDLLINHYKNHGIDNFMEFERITNNYAFELTFIEHLGIKPHDSNIIIVDPHLRVILNNTFLSSLERENSDIVLRSLRMLINLNLAKEVEVLYREKVLRLKLSKIFSPRNIEMNHEDLSSLYEKTKLILIKDMAYILKLIERNRDLKVLNLVLNSFWVEVDKQVRDNLPHITAPGNSELFQRRFCASWNFFEYVAKQCGQPDLARTDQRFQDHMARFNLPVYFEICYQQICGKFETAYVATIDGINIYNKSGGEHKLSITGAYLECLEMCFHGDIFIQHLTDQFTKLSMLLLTRYLSWFDEYTTVYRDLAVSDENIEEYHHHATRRPALQEISLIYILHDLTIVQHSIGARVPIQTTIYHICHVSLVDIIADLTRTNDETITTMYLKMVEIIVTLKATEVILHLLSVNAIPRLYRRTNRPIPLAPSSYLTDGTETLARFRDSYTGLLNKNLSNKPVNLVDKVILTVTERFILLVSDVLHSVSKTEESLKRLKSRNAQQISPAEVPSALSTDPASTDNFKIREQIRLDIGYFVSQCTPMSESETIVELKRLGTSAGYNYI